MGNQPPLLNWKLVQAGFVPMLHVAEVRAGDHAPVRNRRRDCGLVGLGIQWIISRFP